MGLDMYLEKRKKNSDFRQDLCYWRKANQINKWFVDKWQHQHLEEYNGDDIILAIEDLKELLELCKKVKEKAILVNGKIKNGETLENGEWKPIYEDGKYIANVEEIAELLPTQSGFFFGSTEYDEYYMYGIDETIRQLEEVIQNDNGNPDAYYVYNASW